jgi:transcriptional regulator with PAS, ATPase and Fis domain
MCDGDVIDAALVEAYVLPRTTPAGDLPSLNIEQLEKLAIQAAMKRHDNDKRAAAADLGIALKTLYNKLERYGLRQPSGSPEPD